MNTIKKISVVLAILTLCSATAFARSNSDSGRGQRQGPPPEAYTACEDKSAGDTAEFESPRGDTITGTCEEVDGDLVLRPDNPPERGGQGGGRDNSDD